MCGWPTRRSPSSRSRAASTLNGSSRTRQESTAVSSRQWRRCLVAPDSPAVRDGLGARGNDDGASPAALAGPTDHHHLLFTTLSSLPDSVSAPVSLAALAAAGERVESYAVEKRRLRR